MSNQEIRYTDPATGETFVVTRGELDAWKGLVDKQQFLADQVKAGLKNPRLVTNHDPQKEVVRAIDKRRYAERRVQQLRAARLKELVGQRQQSVDARFENERAGVIAAEAKKDYAKAQQQAAAVQAKLEDAQKKEAIAVKIEKEHRAAEERAKLETKRKENEVAGGVRQEFTGSSRGTPEAMSAERLARYRREQSVDDRGIDPPENPSQSQGVKRRRVISRKKGVAAKQEASKPRDQAAGQGRLAPYEQRAGDAEKSFNQATTNKPEIINEPAGSRQVETDAPRPAPSPSWDTSEVDRSAHWSRARSDGHEATAMDRYAAETIAALEASKGSPGMSSQGMSTGFTKSAGQSQGAGLGD